MIGLIKRLQIRRFTLQDLSRIMEIENDSFSVDAFSESTFKKWYDRCHDLFFVAEVKGRIAGYMITCTLPDKGDIVSIAIDPAYRHRGIGRALADLTFKRLKDMGIETIELEVRTTNEEGKRFWKSLGFLPVRMVSNFYRDGEDALRMRKMLEADTDQL